MKSLCPLVVVCTSIAAAALPAAEKPLNVVFILADDLGYECIGADGGQSYKTPQLDALAAGGMRFDRCYAQPLCTPTRVQLMTGMYNVRNYVQFGLLEPTQTTFAQLFRGAGYATGICGKWQLGKDWNLPKHFSFDDYCLWQLMRRPSRYARPGLEINGREVDYTAKEYGPDIVNQYACDFITKHKDVPFLLYYPMMLTHAPYEATPDSSDWNVKLTRRDLASGEGPRKQQRHFGEMVTYMDKLIGKLVAHLDELGLRERTLILFTGDNGTGRGIESLLNGKVIKGGKGNATDAGMHVPLIASWPGTIPAGRVSDDLVDSTDFLPTICAAAGVTVPSNLTIDGHSFLPALRGESTTGRSWIYCWYEPDGGTKPDAEFAQSRDYKLYSDGRLFDVHHGDDDAHPVDTSKLDPTASRAVQELRDVLNRYADARPAKIAGARGSQPTRDE